jgi:magnesium chelatase family protein
MTNDEIKEHCTIDIESQRIFESAVKTMNLSARSFFRVLKVARTIADLCASPSITKSHLLEALSYKNLQRHYDV